MSVCQKVQNAEKLGMVESANAGDKVCPQKRLESRLKNPEYLG